MKEALSFVLRGYLLIGGFFAIITWLSYLIGPLLVDGIGFFDRAYMAALAIPIGAFSGLLRAVFWLPSLILWFAADRPISFIDWLAPGLGVSVVEN